MTALAPPTAVAAYASAVRAELEGLDGEAIDELTGGLEADLTEAFAEQRPDGSDTTLADVAAVFGPPSVYAEELRSAAGIDRPTRRTTTLTERLHGIEARWRRAAEEDPSVRAVMSLALLLRPLWWVVRAWVVFMVLIGFPAAAFGTDWYQRLVLLALVAVSVAWGQQRFGQRHWARRAGLVVGGLATIMFFPAFANATGPPYDWSAHHDGYTAGFNDGAASRPAASGPGLDESNLFVYGPDGEPIESAQILDANGTPVVLANPSTGRSWDEWGPEHWDGERVPEVALRHDQPSNVYPWAYLEPEDLEWREDGTIGALSDAAEPRWPARSVFPLEGHDPADGTDDQEPERPDETTDTSPDTGDEPGEPTAPEDEATPEEE